jgi:hypothetical protein
LPRSSVWPVHLERLKSCHVLDLHQVSFLIAVEDTLSLPAAERGRQPPTAAFRKREAENEIS